MAHRSLWEGVIAFGLVHVPVHLYTAESRERLAFDLLDRRDLARIGHRRINRRSGEVVEWADVIRGYPLAGGRHVALEREDFERAALATRRTIEIVHFAALDAVDPIFYERPYYLAPAPDGERGYVVLREALRRAGRIGVVRFVLRTREHLGVLMVRGPALVVDALRYADELLAPSEIELPDPREAALEISAAELDAAERLIVAMTRPFRSAEHRDTYRDALLAVIAEKATAASGDAEAMDSGDARATKASGDAKATADRIAAPPTSPPLMPAPTRAVDLLGRLRGSLVPADQGDDAGRAAS